MRQRIKRQQSAKEVNALMHYYTENPEAYEAAKAESNAKAEAFKELHPTKMSLTAVSYSKYIGRQYKMLGTICTINTAFEAECLIKSGFKLL